MAGVVWCVLTDGDEYQIYNSTAPVDAAEKLLCQVRLSVNSAEEAADVLGLLSRENLEDNSLEALWKARFVDRKVRNVLEELFRVPDRRLVQLVRRVEVGVTPREVLDSLRRLTVRIEQPPVRFTSRPSKRSPPATAAVRQQQQAGKRARGTVRRAKPAAYRVSLSVLIEAGMLAPPVRLFRKYRKTTLEAVLNADGRVAFGGKSYESCSTAASDARGSITGRPMSTNGWAFWQIAAGGRACTLEEVRSRYLAKKPPE